MGGEATAVDLLGLESSYDQIQLMAIGGMAELYRARQKSLDRPVAIKRIRPELRHNKDIRERFRREAKSSGNLLHQNLAHVYDFQIVADESYIIMEYIDGFDLAEIIERTGPLPIDVAVMIGVRMLNGLGHVHSHGMVHRDLKPDNVRISTRGEIKIMDFGIAYDPLESNLTQPGTLIGSPHYLSPEQITGGKLDFRVDLFAFGITLYEMLTGKKPFFETDKESVYHRIQRGEYISPEALRPEIPPYLVKIIGICLETAASKRPASTEALSGSLTQYLMREHSLAITPRVRQFLLQTKLLQGNPNLIDVHERTFSGPTPTAFLGFFERHKNKMAWLAMALFAALFVVSYLSRRPEPRVVPVAPDSTYTAPVPVRKPADPRILNPYSHRKK